MSQFVLKGSKTILLNSDEANETSLDYEVEEKSSLIVKLQGHQKMHLSLKGKVNSDANFTCLFVNSNEAEVEIEDDYSLANDSNAIIAYSQLNSAPLSSKSNYQLIGEGAQLKVLTVSISSVVKQFTQDTVHLAGHTTANVDNFGIVIGQGKCELVVRNKINKGYHDCQTHQTSRLLTYDKRAVGKILPILYIDDNEVAASHACSLGQPDENQIYYLMTRGLSRQEALSLITMGYLMPITQVIDNEEINNLLKEEIELKVSQSCLK